MNLVQFIQKYSLYKTFYPNQLNEIQLKELESCNEFANVKIFNSVDFNDRFFINNAIDFHAVKLMTNTKFNHKLNLHSIGVFGPFPVHDTYQMKKGLSQFKYATEDTLKRMGCIVYKFDIEELEDKFLSTKEIKKYVAEQLAKELAEECKPHEYYYLIMIRAYKDSFAESVGHGEDVRIPMHPDPEDVNLF